MMNIVSPADGIAVGVIGIIYPIIFYIFDSHVDFILALVVICHSILLAIFINQFPSIENNNLQDQ